VPDGAGDLTRIGGKSPLQLARIPNTDRLTQIGVTGLMETLYDDLPKCSIVAQLGMLGYDPHLYFPHGRASCEALALGIELGDRDLAFRANLVYMKDKLLSSYNANYIKSKYSKPLIDEVNQRLVRAFPEFRLRHNSDFRNTLVVRDVGVDPRTLACPEPHENMDNEFEIKNLIEPTEAGSALVARRINEYLVSARAVLDGARANAIFPWSASSRLELPSFHSIHRFEGRGAVIGHMDFLHGIALAVNLDFFNLGNGDWNTDYAAKGAKAVELLISGYRFVWCHINGPDEASHMGDIERKVYSIEQIDRHVVGPVMAHFEEHPEELGAVIVAPDHYTNHFPRRDDVKRSETHSGHPVPFALYDGHETDAVRTFSESAARRGKYGTSPINHVDLLGLMGW